MPLSTPADGERVLRGLIDAPNPSLDLISSAVEGLQKEGKQERALDLLAEACSRTPNNFSLVERTAELFVQSGRSSQAKLLYARLCNSPSHRVRAHFRLGEMAEAAGDEAAARAHYSHVIVDDFEFPGARKRLDALAITRQPAEVAPTLPGLLAPQKLLHYRLVAELGRGGSGTVYQAHDEKADRPAALKIFHPQAASDWQEARIALSIGHASVIKIFEVDEVHRFLAMELCQGGTLKAALASGLDPRAALAIARVATETLAAVHRMGVIHGDIKPSNFLFRQPLEQLSPEAITSALVLSDFGSAASSSATERKSARGTLGYLAPEQRRGELLPESDVYAMGVVLLELFWQPSLLDPILRDRQRLLRGDPIAPPSAPSELPAALEPPLRTLLARVFAPNPAERPAAKEINLLLVTHFS